MDLVHLGRVTAIAVAVAAVTAGPVSAQDAADPADVTVELPVTVRDGICGEGGELGEDIVYDLGLLGPTVGEDVDVPMPDEVEGLQLSPPVMVLEETIDATFDELLGGSYAVVVASDDAAQPAACGQLGGVVGDGRLAVGLRPLTDERYFGVAVLEDSNRHGELAEGQLLATVYLFQEQGPIGPLGIGATPEAGA